LVAVSPHF